MNPLIKHGTNGYNWKNATKEEKMEFCQFHADALSKIKVKPTEFYFDSLSAFYDTDDDYLLKTELITMLALTLSADSAQ